MRFILTLEIKTETEGIGLNGWISTHVTSATDDAGRIIADFRIWPGILRNGKEIGRRSIYRQGIQFYLLTQVFRQIVGKGQ